MKAKTILRISLFAALLCMITILGAFAAEDTAKIFRFDGMGNVLFTMTGTNAGKKTITSDGNYRIDFTVDDYKALKDRTIQPTFNIDDNYKFNFGDYPYVKIKYKTNYPQTIQFYATTVNKTNAPEAKGYAKVDKDGNDISTSHYIMASLSKSSNLLTKQYSAMENGGFEFVGNHADSRYWPTTEDYITINSTHGPFFQLKDAKDDQITEDIYFELEYIAFFKTEAEMKAYNGVEEAETHAKILAWDGSQNVVSSISIAAWHGKDTVSITEEGNYKAAIDNSGHNVSVNTATRYNIDIDKSEKSFTLYDYPYVKYKYKTDFASNGSQWYINVPEGGYIYNNFNTENTETWIENKYNYNADSSDYTKKILQLTGTGSHSPTATQPIAISAPFFMIRFNGSYKQAENIVAANEKDVLNFEIAYVGFFDSEDAMNAYGTSEENAAIAGINTAVENILNAKTEYKFTVHPAITDKNQAVIDYVDSVLKDIITVSYEAKVDATNSTDELYKVLLTFESDTYSKTIGINVKITELADITPTVKGAQIRKDNTGLRFGFTYNKNTVLTGYDENSVSYGALLISEELLGDKELTTEVGTVDVDYRDVSCENIYDTNGTTGEVTYTAVVTDIPNKEENTTVIVARPYVKYKVGGTEYTAYGKQISRSINQVKDMIDDKWSTDDITD